MHTHTHTRQRIFASYRDNTNLTGYIQMIHILKYVLKCNHTNANT